MNTKQTNALVFCYSKNRIHQLPCRETLNSRTISIDSVEYGVSVTPLSMFGSMVNVWDVLMFISWLSRITKIIFITQKLGSDFVFYQNYG